MLLFELLKKNIYIFDFLFDESIIDILIRFFVIVLKIFDTIKSHRFYKFVQSIFLLKIVLKLQLLKFILIIITIDNIYFKFSNIN